MFDKVLGTLSYVVATFVAMFIVACNCPKKKYFWIKAVVACFIICFIRYLLNEWVTVSDLSRFLRLFLLSLIFLVVFLLCAASIYLCYKCNIWTVLFCGTAGYCMQYVTHKLYELLALVLPAHSKLVETLIIAAITAGVYFLIWFFYFRKINNKGMGNKYLLQIVTVIVVSAFTLFVNTYAIDSVRILDKPNIEAYIIIYSIIMVTVAFLMQVSMLTKNNMENERNTMKQLIEQQREQFKREKENIELLNIKCHDLRHQLRDIQGNIEPEAMNRLLETVKIYDSKIDTGNEAISVVLAKYNYICLKNSISLTCLVDGEELSFIPPHELYALFGNAIENAVHAVEKLDEEKRIINITGRIEKNFMTICFTNYFDGKIEYDGNLPTNRAENHGFGMKSMKMIAEQYGGRINVEVKEDLFTLNVFLPLRNVSK